MESEMRPVPPEKIPKMAKIKAPVLAVKHPQQLLQRRLILIFRFLSSLFFFVDESADFRGHFQ